MIRTANSISAIFAEHGMKGIKEAFKYELQGRKPLIIDEIGNERVMANYTNELDVVEFLVLECYSVKTKMYFTSNLTLEALTELYGTRVVDRIKEMTYITVLEGKSHRAALYESNDNELELIIKN
jgi:DNA replication protein DnaC